MAEHSPVQSLDRAFDLLEILCRSRGGMTIGALSAETGLHKSTVHRLLTSMCMRGYVQRDAETSMYRAGMRLCEMSSYIVDNLDVVDRARAVLERLGRETDETVHLVMRDERDVVYIHKIDGGNSAIRMFSRIGMRLPLYCTGVGKAILATWPRSEARAVWEASDVYAWTENTITDEEAFFREIDKVRQLGYALDNEENEVGVRCIAAAIRTTAAGHFMRSRCPRRPPVWQTSASCSCVVRCCARAATSRRHSAAARDADEGMACAGGACG